MGGTPNRIRTNASHRINFMYGGLDTFLRLCLHGPHRKFPPLPKRLLPASFVVRSARRLKLAWDSRGVTFCDGLPLWWYWTVSGSGLCEERPGTAGPPVRPKSHEWNLNCPTPHTTLFGGFQCEGIGPCERRRLLCCSTSLKGSIVVYSLNACPRGGRARTEIANSKCGYGRLFWSMCPGSVFMRRASGAMFGRISDGIDWGWKVTAKTPNGPDARVAILDQ